MFHVDATQLAAFEEAHPKLYQEIVRSYGPQLVPCIDLIVKTGGADGNEFELEGRGPPDLAHHLPSELREELELHKHDDPKRWLEILSRALSVISAPTNQSQH